VDVKDATGDFPVGYEGFTDYTTVYIGEWDHDDWAERVPEILQWLHDYDDPSWFAWERPRAEFLFEDPVIASVFVLQWTS
jgi:hypothetical protein